ncbi:lipase family protein [bacterium SCSIO 12741]|nr:lipase family protein [bacterium SCSIO 12741]
MTFKRTLLLFLASLTILVSQAGVKPGFDPVEARDMIALCNSFTFEFLYGTDEAIIPTGYEKVFTSSIQGMDNKFQVYKKGDIAVINFRGSTEKAISWVENFYSAMIPAKGKIVIQEESHPYTFATEKEASVHAGYALAVVILSEDILREIKQLNDQGIYQIYITGHSQGGALATMTRAWLENLPKKALDPKNEFKTYAFANPMCGNQEFADEYGERFVETETAFSIINPRDIVPKLPLNYEEGKIFSSERFAQWLESGIDTKGLGKDMLMKVFEGGVKGYITKSNALMTKLISAKFGSVTMPEFVDDINYFPCGDVKELEPFEYPKIEVDTAGMSEDELERCEQGEDGKWYKLEPKFYQHNPYNYFVGTLKAFLPKQYGRLEKRYLEANL